MNSAQATALLGAFVTVLLQVWLKATSRPSESNNNRKINFRPDDFVVWVEWIGSALVIFIIFLATGNSTSTTRIIALVVLIVSCLVFPPVFGDFLYSKDSGKLNIYDSSGEVVGWKGETGHKFPIGWWRVLLANIMAFIIVLAAIMTGGDSNA